MPEIEFSKSREIEKIVKLLEHAEEPLRLEVICAYRRISDNDAKAVLDELIESGMVVKVDGDGREFYARPGKAFLNGYT